jgi:hypothetical protein
MSAHSASNTPTSAIKRKRRAPISTPKPKDLETLPSPLELLTERGGAGDISKVDKRKM